MTDAVAYATSFPAPYFIFGRLLGQTANMLALQSCLAVMAVFGAAVMALPTDQTWVVHHSRQVRE